MSISSGTTVYGENGLTFRLAGVIGKGGEGSVWSLDNETNLVAKFYHNGLSDETVGKLAAMCRIRSEQLSTVAAWPITLLKTSRTSRPTGLLMRRITGFQSVHQLYGMKSRIKLFPEAQFSFLLHSAINTARAFATVHGSGQVIGDVNHSNLMVSQSATVALIDCDSFQIIEGGKSYCCPVGVPEFTPPELQGSSFSAQLRTAQHDAFGLGVLIFYLLFLGRHPFMGMYDPSKDEMLSLDQAIGRYTFPYAYIPGSPQVRLPAYLPRLSDYPTGIGALFKQAFTRDSTLRGRPNASVWVDSLLSLSRALRQCQINPNHQYFNGLKECPWCRVEGAIGTPIFGIKISVRSVGPAFDLYVVWKEIEQVQSAPEQLALPNLKRLEGVSVPDGSLPGLVASRRRFRLLSLGISAIAAIIAFATLVPLAAICVIVASLFVSHLVWQKGNSLVERFRDAQNNANAKYRSFESNFEQASAVPSEFDAERKRLERARTDYQSLETVKAKRLAQLQAAREVKQRQHFLETFRIDDHSISGIGPKFKQLLRLWNIEDAWDIDANVISEIKGFGPVKVSSLVEWRRHKEAMFRFDPSQPVDPRDIQALEQEFAHKRQTLQDTLRSGPQSLRQTLAVWQTRRRQMAAQLHQAAAEVAQANVNHNILRVF